MAIPPARVRVRAWTLMGLYRLAELVYLQTDGEAPDLSYGENLDLTCEVHHADFGYHVVGMKPGAPDISLAKD
jgi:hypothetical protein